MNELNFKRTGDDLRMQQADFTADTQELAHEPPMLVRYLRMLKRWKWLMAGVIAASIIIGLLVTLVMSPQYTAAATLEIQRENNRIVGVEGLEPDRGSIDLEFYQTQYGLLRARSLAERVARELRLADNVAFFEMFGDTTVVESLGSGSGDSRSAAAREQRLRRAGQILLDNVEVSPERLSRLVRIEFTSPDPQFSSQVVNAWTAQFVEATLERRFDATSYARQFLEDRLNQLRTRLEESERALVGYAERENIVNLPTTTSSENGDSTSERPLVAENLSALNSALNQATADRVAAESRLRSAGGATPESLVNQTIAGLREQRAQAAAEYARLMTQFEPQYPVAQALQTQIDELDRAIAREEGRVRNSIENAFQSAAARESALRSRVNGLRGELMNLRGRTIQYNIFQREVDTNRQLYDALLQRYKEIGVAGGVGVNNVSVVDKAEVPEVPSSPNLVVNLLLALLLGAALALTLALALDQIEDAISDPADVETQLGTPLLGTIPKADGEPKDELLDPKSALIEAYLSAQTRLAFSTEHGVPRSILVTSTRPAEGKSTTSFALARTLARTGRKVLLVDADMRSPSLHKILGTENKFGLSNYLAGESDLERMITRWEVGSIDTMTAGPQPPNAAELLTSDRFPHLLEAMLARYDHIVIDAPPVMGLADAPLLASHVEGTVFAIESHATKASAVRVAMGRLRGSGAKVLGVLLTKFQSRKANYGYGYDYGYGYGRSEDSRAEA